MNQQSFRYFLLLLSFLEGGAVMGVELLGAKMLAPFFGTSMPVWAAALGLTLGGLTMGYFAGGRLSLRFGKDPLGLLIILCAAGILISAMPLTGTWVMEWTGLWELRSGAVFSLLIFMVPPLFLLGTVSPIIIELITDSSREAGNAAGTVYAISTTGGILVTFLFGFWIIPEFGIRYPCLLTGLGLMLLPLMALWKRWGLSASLILVPFLLLSALQNSPDIHSDIVYKSEGILGQVKVADFEHENNRYRGLFVNGTLQTVQCQSDPTMHYWAYTRMLDELIGVLPPGNDALLLGMAGGTLVESLLGAGFIPDVVDIDPRMEYVASTFFNIDLPGGLIADDARHFINTSTQKYDLVIFDTFHGESVPTHIITRESLEKLSSMIRPEGLAIINFYGFEHGDEGKISHALFQTLRHQGWNVMVLATPGQEVSRNLEFLITRSDTLLSGIADRYFSKYPHRASSDRTYDFLEARAMPMDRLISDEYSQGPLYNQAAKAWRELYREKRYFFTPLVPE